MHNVWMLKYKLINRLIIKIIDNTMNHINFHLNKMFDEEAPYPISWGVIHQSQKSLLAWKQATRAQHQPPNPMRPCKWRNRVSLYSETEWVCLPAVSVLSLLATPPYIWVSLLLLLAVHLLLLFNRAAYKLYTTETVDATWQKHPVVVKIHGAIAAGLQRARNNEARTWER